MSNGQVSKYLHKDDDAVHIVIKPCGNMISISDKLYASQKVADKHKFDGYVLKLTKEKIIQLLNEQENEAKQNNEQSKK